MLKAQDMSVAKSEVAAKLMAITVFQAAHKLDTVGNPLMAAIRDEAVKLSHEILALHDVKPDEVLVASDEGSSMPVLDAFSNHNT